MTSLFKSDKREEALERLAIGLTEGARNCTTVIKKINTLCQDPEKYLAPFELIVKGVAAVGVFGKLQLHLFLLPNKDNELKTYSSAPIEATPVIRRFLVVPQRLFEDCIYLLSTKSTSRQM